MTYYKCLKAGGLSTHGTGRWTPGRWKSVRGELVPCRRGLHLCRPDDVVHWLSDELWVAEYDGELIEADDKVVVRKARITERVEGWNERTARLFAADCAEHVLRLWEHQYPGDDRPRRAIEATRAFADGLIGKDELRRAEAAALATADAARAAAARFAEATDAAAVAAVAAWDVAYAARAAADATARAADAASYASWASYAAASWADAAERAWQTERLWELVG